MLALVVTSTASRYSNSFCNFLGVIWLTSVWHGFLTSKQFSAGPETRPHPFMAVPYKWSFFFLGAKKHLLAKYNKRGNTRQNMPTSRTLSIINICRLFDKILTHVIGRIKRRFLALQKLKSLVSVCFFVFLLRLPV